MDDKPWKIGASVASVIGLIEKAEMIVLDVGGKRVAFGPDIQRLLVRGLRAIEGELKDEPKSG